MKYMLIIFCLILCSCLPSEGASPDPSSSSGQLGGTCKIELSKEELLFSAEGGLDSVVTNGFMHLEVRECKLIGIDSVECPWFSVIKVRHTAIVSVNKNETNEERKQLFVLMGGDCLNAFLIKQSAE